MSLTLSILQELRPQSIPTCQMHIPPRLDTVEREVSVGRVLVNYYLQGPFLNACSFTLAWLHLKIAPLNLNFHC